MLLKINILGINRSPEKCFKSHLSEPFVPVDVHDDDDLDEGDEGQSGGSIGVHQSQPVLASPGGEQNPNEEAEETAAA